MKNFPQLLVLAFCILFISKAGQAQGFDDPLAYMNAISDPQHEMDQKYMAYMSAAGHGRRARKVEKLRQQTLQSISDTRYKIIALPLYKGDNTYRKSTIDYIQFCYSVFNEDYAKIVNMEEIAEQSVDQMQAYLLLQEKTDQKLNDAAARMNQAEKDFASKYNIKLIQEKSEFGDKIETASKLTDYTNKIFIIYFKCNWEDGQLTKAMNNKKITEAEQARNALISYANEGLQALTADSLRSLKGDPAMAQQCKQSLQFYKKTAEKDIPKMLDFYLKEENFQKIKKAMDLKGNKTQADVDAYNKAVAQLNAGVNEYNQLNDTVNKNRTQMVNDWEKNEKTFTDLHMPYYKK